MKIDDIIDFITGSLDIIVFTLSNVVSIGLLCLVLVLFRRTDYSKVTIDMFLLIILASIVRM